MKRYLISMLVLMFFLIPIVFAADTSSQKQQNVECNYNEYEINISKLEQNITNLKQQIEYYKNLSEYYKKLYEGKNANLTNKEVIEINKNLTIIHQNISNLFQRIENIENELTSFSFKFGISLISLTVLGVTLIELVFKFLRRKINNHDDKK